MPLTSHGQSTAIGVKAHVLFSQLLKPEEYWGLLNLNSTTEIAGFLKQTEGYKEHLDLLPFEKVHRVDLENAVRSAVLSEATSFLSYLAGAEREFLSIGSAGMNQNISKVFFAGFAQKE